MRTEKIVILLQMRFKMLLVALKRALQLDRKVSLSQNGHQLVKMEFSLPGFDVAKFQLVARPVICSPTAVGKSI